ncbi:MAG TPA: DUF1697 domain-containing protein [Gemmatimonadota bacterium]
MKRRYVAFLRAISNVGMKPFRQAIEELGFADVESYGMSGNLLFNARGTDTAGMERRIARRLSAPAFVRTRAELARIVGRDPYGSSILFLARAPTKAKREAFRALEFEARPPILSGKTAYYVWPARLRGKRTPLDLERVLGVQGTFRSSRVVRRLVELMAKDARPKRRR